MNKRNYSSYYFIGIGGIGMSNLARYFMSKGSPVGGYDSTESTLTQTLSQEGALIHYIDNIELVPKEFIDKDNTLIVYTPAVPNNHSELSYFRKEGFTLMKRAQLLGEITKHNRSICVAGTHGKTTVSSITAHILYQSALSCNAFLGGILKNYGTNLLLTTNSDITVIEADEYDRSFHWLHPWIAIITSADPDHLDIYGTPEAYRESFEKFTSLIQPNGYLIVKRDIPVTPKCDKSIKIYTYSIDDGDYHAENIRIANGEIYFDFISPKGRIDDMQLGVPVSINIENSIAAAAAAELSGATPSEIRNAISTFGGSKRRFDVRMKNDKQVFIDDYAHHPQELTASISSIKALYPDKKVTGIFQPHLFTRTRDFALEFAKSLSLLDEVILLDIYPAREEPIEGITSEIIFDKITTQNKTLCKKSDLLFHLKNMNIEVLVTLGAGDIDRLLPEIEALLNSQHH